MRKKPRNSDGTLRCANQPELLTNRTVIARWVEAVTLQLKRVGMGYQAIADHIMAVAHGQQNAVVPVPRELAFPQGYRISMQGVHRAFLRAIVRLPNAEAAALRKLDSERLEDMLLSLQSGIRRGDPRSIEVAVKLLAHKAEINGYKAPSRVEMTGGTQVNVLVQQQAAADAQALVDLGRLTLEELREYRRLEAKAQTAPDAIETETAKEPEAPDEVAADDNFEADNVKGGK